MKILSHYFYSLLWNISQCFWKLFVENIACYCGGRGAILRATFQMLYYIKILEIQYLDKKVTMKCFVARLPGGDWIRNGCTKYSIVAHWIVNPWMIFFVPGFCKLFTLNFTTMLLQNAVLYFYHRPEARLLCKCCHWKLAETLANGELESVAVKIKDNLTFLPNVFLVINELLLLCPAFEHQVHPRSWEYFHCSLWQNKWPFPFTNVKKPELLFFICLFKTHFVECFRNFNVEFFNRKINLVTTFQPSSRIMTMANWQISVHVAQLKWICGRGRFSSNLPCCEAEGLQLFNVNVPVMFISLVPCLESCSPGPE